MTLGENIADNGGTKLSYFVSTFFGFLRGTLYCTLMKASDDEWTDIVLIQDTYHFEPYFFVCFLFIYIVAKQAILPDNILVFTLWRFTHKTEIQLNSG